MIIFFLMILPLISTSICIISGNKVLSGTVTICSAILISLLSVLSGIEILATNSHFITYMNGWLGIDPLSEIMILLVSFITFFSALFGMGYMKFKNSNEIRRYYVNFNLFVFALLAVPLIQEPNMVWIAVELTTIFSVLLVGFANTHEALEAAWKYIVLTLMGASIALLGFFMLFWAGRTAGITTHYTWSNISIYALKMPYIQVKTAFLLILIGLGAKIGIVPLHTWLPDAYSQAPTPVCALLGALENSIALYVILRLICVFSKTDLISYHLWITWIGIISTGTAAFLLLQVKDIKRLLAFSSIEHMGIILIAVGMGGTTAFSAGIIQLIVHSFTKSFCFYAVGLMLLLSGSGAISVVKGLFDRSSLAGSCLLIGGLAIAGAPPFAIFTGEFLIIKAGFQHHAYFTMTTMIFFIAIAFFAIMDFTSKLVFGSSEKHKINTSGQTLSSTTTVNSHLPLFCVITLILAVIPVILLGIYIPEPLRKLILLASTL